MTENGFSSLGFVDSEGDVGGVISFKDIRVHTHFLPFTSSTHLFKGVKDGFNNILNGVEDYVKHIRATDPTILRKDVVPTGT